MGSRSSKSVPKPNNPLQELQYKEKKRELRKIQKEKELKQIAKIVQKHKKKNQGRVTESGTKNSKSFTIQQRRLSVRRSSSKRHCKIGSSTRKRANVSGANQSTSHTPKLRQSESTNGSIEQKTVEQLEDNLNTFLINQIALGQEFFGNYEREVVNITKEILAKESEMNQHLEEHSILLGNSINAIASKYIAFRRPHGPEKQKSQPLQPRTMYIVFDNIDVARPTDANYDSISPLCKLDMDVDFYKTTPRKEDYMELLEEIKWKGYVRLKFREDPRKSESSQLASSRTSTDIYTDGSSGYSTTSLYSTKSMDRKTDRNSDYAYINHLSSHHPFKELKLNSYQDVMKLKSKNLPEACISKLGDFVDIWQDLGSDEDPESDGEDEGCVVRESSSEGKSGCKPQNPKKGEEKTRFEEAHDVDKLVKGFRNKQEKINMLSQQAYLNSKEFMRYFGELLRQQLAPLLNITPEELQDSSYRGASIYTNRFELIPTLHVPQIWPDCAFPFRLRQRGVAAATPTGTLSGPTSQWPSSAMIKTIESFGFHLIPVGYTPKNFKRQNPFRDLEWCIVFPKAERYLEKQLSKPQIKVYLMAKTLLKAFLEPKDKTKSLLFALDHLRTHLFWECESNYTGWSEEFLGERLLNFLESFKQRLQEKYLKDYFIEERNLFDVISESSLSSLVSIISDIISNPLMHLMMAFRCLEHAEIFFPKLNFKRIFEYLVEKDVEKLEGMRKEDVGVQEAPNLQLTPKEREEHNEVEKESIDAATLKKNCDKSLERTKTKSERVSNSQRKRSIESIDLEFMYLKSNQDNELESLRRIIILEVLLRHFLEMSEKAVILCAVYQAKQFEKQAGRLCQIYEGYGYRENAKRFRTCIQKIEDRISSLALQQDPNDTIAPALPSRISLEAVIRPFKQNEETDAVSWRTTCSFRKHTIEHVALVHRTDEIPSPTQQRFLPGSRVESEVDETRKKENSNDSNKVGGANEGYPCDTDDEDSSLVDWQPPKRSDCISYKSFNLINYTDDLLLGAKSGKDFPAEHLHKASPNMSPHFQSYKKAPKGLLSPAFPHKQRESTQLSQLEETQENSTIQQTTQPSKSEHLEASNAPELSSEHSNESPNPTNSAEAPSILLTDNVKGKINKLTNTKVVQNLSASTERLLGQPQVRKKYNELQKVLKNEAANFKGLIKQVKGSS